MKAFLLAAGYGKRLRPITYKTPKCLVPINDIPLIEYWFRLFRKYGIKDVLINSHYLPEKINDYIRINVKDLKIKLKFEEKLLGSLGCILNNTDYISNEKSFLIFYSDNLTNFNINEFIFYHESHNLPVTVGLFHCLDPTLCGIASIDKDNTIIGFEEKPKNPKGNMANAGIYAFDRNVINDLKFNNYDILDISLHLLPKLIGQMKGFIINDFIIDIGTISNYKKAGDYIALNPNMFGE